MAKNFQFLTCEEVINLPSPVWVVEKVIPEKGFAVLYGPPGTAKSFLVLDMASKVALGDQWLGIETTEGPCLYLCGEGQGSLKFRVEALVKNIGSIPTKVSFGLESFHLIQETQDFIEALLEQRAPPSLIILDTLSRCIVNCDENSAKDMGSVTAAIQSISKETGASVLVVHHTGKNPGKGARGSSSIHGAADAFIAVKKQGKRISVSFEKLKDSDGLPTKVCILEKVILDEGSSCVLKFLEEEQQNSQAIKEREKRALNILCQHPKGLRSKDWLAECIEAGISDSTFNRAKKGLLEQQQIHQIKNGKEITYFAFQNMEGKTKDFLKMPI